MDATPILRPAARVLLIDSRDRLLLIHALVDPQAQAALNGFDFWLTPGGGVNEGETFEEAALRELWEEAGIGDVDLGPCVWMRTHVYPWDGKVYKQQERYFVSLVDEVEVTDKYWTDDERKVLAEFRWWSLAEIEASEAVFVPRRLGLLLPRVIAGDHPAEPIAIGV